MQPLLRMRKFEGLCENISMRDVASFDGGVGTQATAPHAMSMAQKTLLRSHSAKAAHSQRSIMPVRQHR
jgi:hypothetical protein